MAEAPPNPFDLRGKTIVVTGGNRGIGLGMARGLAQAGADLSLWARDESKNEEACRELQTLGVQAQSLRCDVSSEADVVAATEATLERFGRIDAGFANAGYGSPANALKMSLEEFRALTSVNLDGVFLTFRELGRHMSEREGGGKLVAISSISAVYGTPAQPHYAASKGGLEAMVRSYAVRLARYDVQCNSVEPGWVETEATAPAVGYEDFSKTIMARVPARRWGQPEDMAGIAVYLASDASRFHTGDTIRVDGGYSIF